MNFDTMLMRLENILGKSSKARNEFRGEKNRSQSRQKAIYNALLIDALGQQIEIMKHTENTIELLKEAIEDGTEV